MRTLLKKNELQNIYLNFSKYMQNREIIDISARKIQTFFRKTKALREKKIFLEETIVKFKQEILILK